MNRFTLKCITYALLAAATNFGTANAQMATGPLPVNEITPILSNKYLGLRTSNSTAEFLYVGTPDLAALANRRALSFRYQPTVEFTITYDRLAGTFSNTTRTINGSGATVVNTTTTINDIMNFVGSTKAAFNNKINYLQMNIRTSNTAGQNGQVFVENLKLNGADVGGTYQGFGTNNLDFYMLNATFSTGFTLTGTIRLTGTFNGDQEKNFVDFTWGHYTGFSTLPLGFTSFKGTAENNKRNKLTWTTADNHEGKYFEVQRSEDGRSYSTIGTVQVSEEKQTGNYSYYDTRPVSNAWYRIKAVDINSKFIYSAAIRVSQRLGETRVLQQTGSTELLFPDVQNRSVTVYNMSGMIMQKGTASGINYTITHQNLKKGVYVFRVNGTHETESRQFVVL